MSIPKGFHEELFQKNKSYPDQRHVYPLEPTKYVEVLTQQLARKIGEKLETLAHVEDYQNMIRLVDEIEQTLFDSPSNFEFPLSAVHYWHDEQPVPLIYPGMFLSQPTLITNQSQEINNFFKTLKVEMMTADQVDFMVSFIRWSGLQLLLRSFEDLKARGKKVRILTSTYLNVTEPKALRSLLGMDHVEVKVFESGKISFHTKAYLFTRDSEMNTVIIGSSNLSHSALKTGYEWNVKLPNEKHLRIFQRANDLFEEMWNDERAIPLSTTWIEEYENVFESNLEALKVQRKTVTTQQTELSVSYHEVSRNIVSNESNGHQWSETDLQPNAMQVCALIALKQTREKGHTKGVIIAATGTGKTFLSAFDVQQFQAKRVLFIAHRDELLENAKKTFALVMGTDVHCGKLTGQIKEWEKPFLFSTIQTLHREGVLTRFAHDHFDYIVVDEFHHAEASTYRKVLDYFQPQFLLGVTATPERMDGRDVLSLCNHNVVYEIRLHEALDNGLLAPFHYFGLSDTVDYDQIAQRAGQFDEAALVKALNTHQRVEYVIEMINKYGHDGKRRKALGFCASVEHAKFMAEEFNLQGYCANYLTGTDSPELRQAAVSKLEDDEDPLEFIFTVNIFNEGIDIPSLNLVLFLRPTESATLFLQQLGRGLRKAEGKEYVTILDFIGNYQKSFIVPLALSGQTNHKAFDRDALRVTVETDFADLPDGCYVDLEEISRQRILEKVAEVRMDANQMLADLYNNFRKELGNAPEIEDFLYSPHAPSLHYFIRKYGSWVETKKKMKDLNEFDQRLLDSPLALEIVQRLEQSLPLKWPYEFAVLHVALQKQTAKQTEVIQHLQNRFGVQVSAAQHEEYIIRAMKRLTQAYKKNNWGFGQFDENERSFTMNATILDVWKAEWVEQYLQMRLEYGLIEFRRTYKPEIFFNGNEQVILYQNYKRNDLIYLFKSDAKEGTWREGVSSVGNNILLFITLRKGEDVAEHLNYHDYFIDQNHFHWQSQNATSHSSKVGQNYIYHKERGLHIHLFVRKYESMYGEVLPFMYVGEINYVKSNGDKPMNIVWKLENPLPEDLFLDFVR